MRRAVRSFLGQKGGFLHSVSTLVGGTAIAQGLAILALPLLTRLYSPADFSVLAVYASALSIFGVVACLRLEIAIPLPEGEEDAAALFVAALIISFLFALGIALVLLVFKDELLTLVRGSALEPYLWVMPIGVWLASAYSAAQFWATRRKRFSRIAKTRMYQSLGGVSVQAGVGLIGGGAIGLLLGHLISSGAGVIELARDAWRQDWRIMRSIRLSSMFDVLRKYRHYPTYSSVEALANNSAMHLPIVLIAAVAIGPEAGFLLLATRVLAAPLSLVGASVAQVYIAHAANEFREERLGDFTARILVGLLKVGVGPIVFAGVISVPLAGVVFGKEWARVGELIAWMTPWFVFQFLSQPVSMVMHVAERQKAAMILQVAGGLLRIGAVLVSFKLAPDFISEAYALSGAFFYAACCLIYYRIAGVSVRSSWSRILPAAWSIAFFLVLALFARWGLAVWMGA